MNLISGINPRYVPFKTPNPFLKICEKNNYAELGTNVAPIKNEFIEKLANNTVRKLEVLKQKIGYREKPISHN